MSAAPSVAAPPAARATRIEKWLDFLAGLSEPGPGVSRLAYTELEREAHTWFRQITESLGMSVHTDAAGNTIAELPGSGEDPRWLGTGSHLDSVPSGGRFDGIAGVVAAVEMVHLLVEGQISLQHPLRIVAFAGEEGSRFGQACNGSRMVTGLTTSEDLATIKDAQGVSLREAMLLLDLRPDDLEADRWQRKNWLAFVELHIEQGSVLEDLGIPIGVVDMISGSSRLMLKLTGVASHSGGTPMYLRSDALAAAAELVLAAEHLARDPRHHGTRTTVGRLEVQPGSITTIPGEVTFTLDIRDVDAVRQRETAREFLALAAEICGARGVALRHEILGDTSPVVLPRSVRDIVATAADRRDIPIRIMASGASHDTQMVNRVVPGGMIFVPSRDGISHDAAEWSDPKDIARGTDVLLETMLLLDREDHLR